MVSCLQEFPNLGKKKINSSLLISYEFPNYDDDLSELNSQILEVASLMRSLLRILPDGFLGIEVINATLRILLYGATCVSSLQ